MPGLIAIVGRPNVGKSALFNRIVGRRIAIVHDQPGVTRDRITAEAEWRGRSFTLIDTGGLGLMRGEKADDVVVRATTEQVGLALEAAHAIILVTNVQEGVAPLDREVAQHLRRAGKPVLVAVNKVDEPRAEAGLPEFSALGFERIFPISAIHGRGIESLVETATGLLPAADPAPALATGDDAASAPLKLAVVGRPNVGKSSLVNALTRSERVIVSPIPGTTRDAIDVPFEVETDGRRERYVLVDTAGIRKTRSVADSIEFFSVKRAEQSIERCDLVIFVLDAKAGILEQDKKIADRIVEARKGCLVVVNKWDLFEAAVQSAQQRARAPGGARGRRGERPRSTLAQFGQWVQEKLFFLDYAPVIFTSAQSGFHLDRLLEAVRFVASQMQQRIPTAILNRTLRDAIERRQPVSAAGSRMKFYYATQVKPAPPTFLLFVNRAELFTPAYEKYLADQLRRAFGYEGCPIALIPRSRPKTVAPKRKQRVRGTHRPE
ncbi:MAG TPA: ribosome biogenesis GTPase Der [Verrucomicrobiota bacterium]|nr:ribosome biogenesis GTPase Der [Verrucomicrobiota bacterium]